MTLSVRSFLLRFAIVWMALIAAPAMAQTVQGVVMTNANGRAHQDLSGPWAISIDPYRDGVAGFHGAPASGTARRYVDLDTAEAMKANPKLFYEFDFDHGPRVNLPGSWNSTDPQLRYFDGLVWYQRHFTQTRKAGERVFLRIEAANYKTYAYLNGKAIGTHEGGFTPFVFEITNSLRDGDNRITLGVDSEHSDKAIPPTVTDWDIYGGVTRPISVIAVPETFVDDAFVYLGDDGRIRADVRLNGPKAAGQTVTLNIAGLKLKTQVMTDDKGEAHVNVPAPKGLKLWSPEKPALYDVVISTAADSLTDRVGFRTIKVVGDKIMLNGKSVFLRGISLHEEEIGANPARLMTEDAVRKLLNEIKTGLNGNFVRLAHYPHSELTARLADEIGLLVWSEIPVYWRVDFKDPEVLKLGQTMLRENILRDRNRASIVIWSVANETPVSDARNAFLSGLVDTVRGLDKTRLVSAALLASRVTKDGQIVQTIDDPMVDKFDVMSVNTYNGWYSEDDLSVLPGIIWKAPRTKPLIFSEFGADAKFGYHNDKNSKFTEEFQAEYYRQTLSMADKVPYLAGLSPWILKDFRSPRRQHPVFQEGWNRKGLISELGERKQGFKVLSDYYAKKAKAN